MSQTAGSAFLHSVFQGEDRWNGPIISSLNEAPSSLNVVDMAEGVTFENLRDVPRQIDDSGTYQQAVELSPVEIIDENILLCIVCRPVWDKVMENEAGQTKGVPVDDIVRISDAEIVQVLPVRDFVESCDEAFRLYGLGEMKNPSRREEVQKEGREDVFRLELPGEWPGRYRARKVIEERSDGATGRLGERTAAIELEDLRSGRRAVLDAEYITNMRTGAAGALGARYLARKDVQRVAILGTGRIARALALCADWAHRPAEIRATSRRTANREAFEAAVGPEVRAKLHMVDSIAACVSGADAVFAAVPTPGPILGSGDIPADVHLSVMGGDSRTVQLDLDLLCSRAVVVDHPDQARESGEFRVALERNRYGEIGFARDGEGRALTVGDAALGRLEGLRGKGAIAYFTGWRCRICTRGPWRTKD